MALLKEIAGDRINIPRRAPNVNFADDLPRRVLNNMLEEEVKDE